MSPEGKLTLTEARRKGKLDQFINEHEADPEGDSDALERTIGAMTAGKGKQSVEKPE